MKSGLTAEEIRICDLMGVNPHEYIESRALGTGTNAETQDRQELIKKAEQDVMRAMGIDPGQARRLKVENEAAYLTGEEIEVCLKMGVFPLDYLAQKMKAAGLTKHPLGKMEVK